MKRIIKNRTIIGIACIMLSLLICFGLTPMYTKAFENKIQVVRVVKPIQKGDRITFTNIKLVEVGGYNIPDNVIKNIDSVEGRYAKADFEVGDYILASKLSEESLSEYDYLDDFTGSERAISVSVKNIANVLSGKLERGDIVSAYVTDYGINSETLSPEELKYVEVLAVTLTNLYDNDQIENTNVSKRESPITVTLKVSESQAIQLADLNENGKIHLCFVYRGDEKNRMKFINEQKDYLEKTTSNDEKGAN